MFAIILRSGTAIRTIDIENQRGLALAYSARPHKYGVHWTCGGGEGGVLDDFASLVRRFGVLLEAPAVKVSEGGDSVRLTSLNYCYELG